MVDKKILASLNELQDCSRNSIPEALIAGMTQSFTKARYELIRTRVNPTGSGVIIEPTNGGSSLARNTQSLRKLMTLPPGTEDNFTYRLNTALLGGESYPILTAALGTLLGAVSSGAGLLFSAASTAISLSQSSHRVLARAGDELWQVEEIGKKGSEVVHVGSYFLVDPFRTKGISNTKGWLIHEERSVLNF
ncbi:hypothetical protein [Bowmanella denitrificans]|uniref:hypothetical protein n=1 Tax=Bowmanella denitrificans TaxID=366582 RepID=UPI000C9ADC42|nr:hypothetical protein [Bowmanella denitrificans]